MSTKVIEIRHTYVKDFPARLKAEVLCDLLQDNAPSSVIKDILMSGVDVNRPFGNDRTAYTIALHKGADELAYYIDVYGGKCDVVIHKISPFHLAAAKGQTKIIEMMLENNQDMDIDHQSKNGQTALMYAAVNGHEGVVDVLLQNGAEIARRNDDGMAAAQLAMNNGHHNVAYKIAQHYKALKLKRG